MMIKSLKKKKENFLWTYIVAIWKETFHQLRSLLPRYVWVYVTSIKTYQDNIVDSKPL